MGGEGLLLTGIQPGMLVYSSQDGRVADDMPAPFAGDNLDDLSRGSVAPFDPFLGPISLTAGEYLLLVTKAPRRPANTANSWNVCRAIRSCGPSPSLS